MTIDRSMACGYRADALRVWILAVVLAFSMLPSMEAVEAAVQLVQHGDLAHHDEHDLGTDEHGCSGTFHLCDCHGVSAVPPALASVVIRSAPAQIFDDNFDLDRWSGLGATAPPIRPPIA